ncbi:equilibrative nucleoside transporter 4 isoform X2 [Planococcus citri]|uniref:equilibrative nucleoside transporter 4 isoform X2 n=1 Tax=Planococcus citri TaxID=170843 RepID=UPI0031F91018
MMEERLSHGYIQLGKSRTANDFRFTKGFNHISPPVDKYNGIYLSLVLAGIGFLLPYNSFIIAVDYFQSRYPDSTIIFDMSLVYIVVSFFAVLANNVLVEALPLNTRITFGYLISFVTLVFVALCEVWWEVFGSNISYFINLIAVATVALGCTIQQSSFYGYTSMLPSRYTQAVMAGESAAGFLVSVNRILTKFLLSNQQFNTLLFFGISSVGVAVCFILHQIVERSDFIQFYLTLCRESKKIVLEPTEDAGLIEALDQNDPTSRTQYGVLKLRSQNSLDTNGNSSTALSFANPVYEPNDNNGPSYKVEDVVVKLQRSGSTGTFKVTNTSRAWNAIKRGMATRWIVAKNIWQYMVSICAAYFVTLSLYPGIISEIKRCPEDHWFPVLLMTLFNGTDLIGKMLASIQYEWLRSQLFIFACWRIMLIPFLILCAAPRGKPLMSGEGYPMFFSGLLGITNGIVGSVPMIQAPRRVSEEHRELAGNIMTLSYNVGLTGGALAAYLLEKLLGPAKLKPCTIPSVKTVLEAHNITTKQITKVTAVITTTIATHVVKELSTAPTTMASILSILPNATSAFNATINNEIH